jgi:2-C-methyl-D-erythritol 4-phosphate cytidylyltransferase
MKSAIILAGGNGTRFNGKKQFVEFRGKALWQHVYDKVIGLVDEVVIVGVDITPGETRTGSVRNGLNALSAESERVIILEAARPLVTQDQIVRLLESPSNSCSFVTPLVDTIIIEGHNYPDRKKCYSLQTPQAFNTQMLLEAYRSEKFSDMTDETRVMYEYFNEKPELINGGANLYKVTYPHDITLLETIIQKYNMEHICEK